MVSRGTWPLMTRGFKREASVSKVAPSLVEEVGEDMKWCRPKMEIKGNRTLPRQAMAKTPVNSNSIALSH